MNDLQCYVLASVISADNDEFGLTEEQKQDIMHRYDMRKQSLTAKHSSSTNGDIVTWETVFEPIPDKKHRDALIELFSETEI